MGRETRDTGLPQAGLGPVARRDFIRQVSAAGLAGCVPGAARAAAALNGAPPPAGGKIWGGLIHLSFNGAEEYIPAPETTNVFRGFRPYLRVDEPVWRDAMQTMAENGANMVVISLGDAVKYASHPEIAVRDAWSPRKLREELKKIRDLGMEPIPLLNFSAAHDTWLKDYSRMVSTDIYYKVCADLIAEVCDLFDSPRLFHLGMDEEDLQNQRYFLHVVIRQNDAWWNDLAFFVEQAEKNKARAWIWSDNMLWPQPEQFFKRMPKTVLQSNWYYGAFDNPGHKGIQSYLDLDKAGYEQIPTGAYRVVREPGSKTSQQNIGATVDFCKRNLNDKLLLGFLQTWWCPTIEEYRAGIMESIRWLGEARKRYYP